MPDTTPAVEEIPHGTLSGYRGTLDVGGTRPPCHCALCRAEHSRHARQQRQEARYGLDGPMSPAVRARLLELITAGASVRNAAASCGLTHQAVYAAARVLPAFATQLAAAEAHPANTRETQ